MTPHTHATPSQLAAHMARIARNRRLGVSGPVPAPEPAPEPEPAPAHNPPAPRAEIIFATPEMEAAIERASKRDIINLYDPAATVEPRPHQQILMEVCKKHQISKAELLSRRRSAAVVTARWEAMWRMKYETTMSLPRIGRLLGGRDHTTVMHGVRRYEQRMREETR